MKLELWETKKDIQLAEDGLLKLEVQYRTGNYDEEYDLKSEIDISKERIRLSKLKLKEATN